MQQYSADILTVMRILLATAAEKDLAEVTLQICGSNSLHRNAKISSLEKFPLLKAPSLLLKTFGIKCT